MSKSRGNCIVEFKEDVFCGLERCFNEGWTEDGICFSLYSKEGSIIQVDSFNDGFSLSNDFHNDLFVYNQKVYALPSSNGSNNYLLEYDPETGVIDEIRNFNSDNGDAIVCSGFHQISDNEMVISFITGSTSPFINILHFKDGNILNEFVANHSNDAISAVNFDVDFLESGNILISGNVSYENAFYIPYFQEYNLEGDLVWEFELPEEYAYHIGKDTYIDNVTGEMIFTTSFESESSGFGSEPHIIKINKEKEILWDKPFGIRLGQSYGNSYERILLSQEGDGYIVAGGIYSNLTMNISAAVGKLSLDGDSIWHRTFHYSSNLGDKHMINDLEYCGDQGYIGIGTHTYGNLDYVPQGEVLRQSLLIKVNSDGLTSMEDLGLKDEGVLIFPNPTSDILNIKFSQPYLGSFQIFSLHGIMVKQSNCIAPVSDLELDITDFNNGMYFLIFERENGKIGELRFIVLH